MLMSEWSSYVCSSDRAALAPEVGGLDRRHQDLVAAGAILFLAHALLDPLQHAVAERQPRVDSCRSEEHTSVLQSLMRISYAAFCLKTLKSHSFSLFTVINIHTRTQIHNCNTHTANMR